MKFYKIKELIIINPKSNIKVRDSKDSGKYLFFTSGEKTKFYNSFLCKGKNIFIATGGKANFSYYEGKAAYSTDCYSITTKNFVETKFLYYFLKLKQSEINNTMFQGAALKHLQKKHFNDLEIKIPSLSVQRDIVARLDAAFVEIDKDIEMQTKNNDKTISLFNSYISKAFRKGHEGWQTKLLKDLCENYKKDIVDGPFGSNLKTKHFINEGIPVLKIQNIKEFYINKKKMSYISYKKFNDLKRHSFKSGDIIMTKLGQPLGVSAIVEDLKEGVIVADLVRIRANKINTEFLCYQLNSPLIKSYINSMQKGTTRPRIRLSIVRELLIYLPNYNEQERIIKKIKNLRLEINKLRKIYSEKNYNLNCLKNSLIKDLLNINKWQHSERSRY